MLTFDLLTLKALFESRVTWANFSLPRTLCSRVTPDVRDRRQTDRRQTKASLNASALWGRRHNKCYVRNKLSIAGG